MAKKSEKTQAGGSIPPPNTLSVRIKKSEGFYIVHSHTLSFWTFIFFTSESFPTVCQMYSFLRRSVILTVPQQQNFSVTVRWRFTSVHPSSPCPPSPLSSSPLVALLTPRSEQRQIILQKQGSIRPGSSVTLASHLPGRGLTSQAASRALSWTSSA